LAEPLDKNPCNSNQTNFLATDHFKSELKQRSIQGGFVTVIAQIFKFILLLVSNLLLARLLNPEAYGLIGMVTAITNFVTLFKDLGLSMATIQTEKLTQEQVSNLFWINVTFSFLCAIFTIAVAPILTNFYHEPRLFWITISLSVGLLISGLGVQHAALLSRQMHYNSLIISDVSSQILGFSIAIFLAWYGFGYWALVMLPLVVSFVNTIGVWIACSWRPSPPIWKSKTKSLLLFGANISAFSILDYFALNLDNVLIGKFWGTQQLGLYAKAYQMLLLPISQINAPITNIIVPLLSRLTDSPERYRKAYCQTIETVMIITTPLILFMISASDLLVLILLGPQWAGISPLFIILGVSGIFRPIMNSMGWLFISQDRSSDLLQWGIIGSTIAVLSFLTGLPWGASGVATTYTATIVLISMPLLFWFVGRKGPIRTNDLYRSIAPIICSAIITTPVLFLYRRWIELPLVINSLIIFGITIICFYGILILFPKGKEILKNLKNIAVLLKNV
jgi:PST family polysaccharide transporter